MWFDAWHGILRVLAVGCAAYLALVVLLRVSGKRTLTKLNAFDLVVTVALGSTLATILLSSSVAWAEGVAALATLVVLQFVVATVTARLPSGRALLTAEPTILLRDGEARSDVMRRHRVSLEELRQAVRGSGSGDLSAIAAVVLETDGTLSVIPASKAGDLSALAGLDDTDRAPS